MDHRIVISTEPHPRNIHPMKSIISTEPRYVVEDGPRIGYFDDTQEYCVSSPNDPTPMYNLMRGMNSLHYEYNRFEPDDRFWLNGILAFYVKGSDLIITQAMLDLIEPEKEILLAEGPAPCDE